MTSEHELSHDPELTDWRVLLGRLQARFSTGKGGFSAGAEFASRVAARADELDHHPDIDLRYPHVTVTTLSHDVGRLTGRDRRLAIAISQIAAELGLRAAPEQLSALEIGLDVMVAEDVAPFWRAVLGYEPGSDEDAAASLADPAARHAGLWFQQMDERRTERGRFHLDITVPHDVAEQRLAAAMAAGGRLVTDEFAPSWWVLADAEGNEACICTWQGRGQGDGS
ncbi:VOC family protein [Ornithinimicrobium pratense]|uniref:Putative pterin-4-alpha-carbinolamine dehydratase n=1 Tax=Ornithinimicrobium pratense TaxID=2593973 RepID=A0A5J6V2I5_9MICO|nr:VOC family protein [Ornithinimicrobium pratense]QFG68120.1 pterin-4-alpha-carbinolamine dehydratase [Ornithinimicrobium pratense]